MYRHVLIVEDDDPLRQIVAANLRRRGPRVGEAATATQALAALVDERPDLVLLVINLPDLSGWEVAREMRQRALDVPTIVVSAAGAAPNRLAELRPLAFLAKPIALDELHRLAAGAATTPAPATV